MQILHLQLRTTNGMQHQRCWTATAGKQSQTLELERSLNVPPRQWIHTSRTFVPCSCLAAELGIPDKSSAGERQELLWRQYFLDPSLWWDCRTNKKSGRSPDFRHKESKERLWLNSFYKPDWVDAQLDVLDKRVGRSAQPLSNPSLHHIAAPPQGYGTAQAVVEQLFENGQLSRAVDALTALAEAQSRVSTSLLYRIIRRCGAEKNLVLGRRLDHLTIKLGYESNAFLGNHILRMYACQGRLQEAMQVFTRVATPSVHMWFSIISAQTAQGEPSEAIQLYHKMRRSSLKPNNHIFVAALQACARAADVESGRQVHADVLESGIQPDAFVWNCLVDMYAKCGELGDARKVFDGLSTRDTVTWNAMIAGYVEHGLTPQALALYASMEQEGLILANSVTYVCLLKACASAGALQQGRQLHSGIVERGLLEGDVVLGTCLVNMYAKCGQLEDARKVFSTVSTRDVVTWNAMINGYGRNSEGHSATACFEEMMLAGIQPDDATFTCLLVACSHAGLVSKGRQYFDAMVKQHGLNPTPEHYHCMVDLLARAGHLGEAEKMLKSAGCEKDDVGLMSLLNACKSHGDIERGSRCFENLRELDPKHAGAYVLMANMYADADRWADVDRIERLRKLAGANKKPAVAGIEVNKQVHTFVVGDERNDISCKVRSTNDRLKEEGNHVPHTKLVLKPLSEKEKEDQLCGHAEKLALAFGLLNTPDGTPLLVTKNLRMCRDCHSSTEIMSRVEKRDIFVRDAYRVHRFEAGSCSCKGRH